MCIFYGSSERVEKLGKNAPLVVIRVRMKFRVVPHDYIHHLTAIRAYVICTLTLGGEFTLEVEPDFLGSRGCNDFCGTYTGK